MEPLFVSVVDNNVEYLFSEDSINDSDEDSKISSQSILDHTGCKSKYMFPNRIKYIFEDDLEDSGRNNPKDIVIHDDEASAYENIIIVDMDEYYQVEKLKLISDKFQLLGFESVGGINDENSVKNLYKEVNIEVVSKFKDLSNISKELPLNKLINIYNIQNKQLQSLYDSI